MPELPPFDFNATFNPLDAWHDRIEWHLQPGALVESEEDDADPQAFLYRLCCPDTHTANSQDPSPAFGWLFNPSSQIFNGYSRTIRKSVLRWGDEAFQKPLISGQTKLRRTRGGWLVQLQLQVNPSRWVHHHPRGATEPGEDGWLNQPLLSASRPLASFDGEFSLDGNDNWVPDAEQYRAKWRRPNNSTNRYIRLVEEAILGEVERAGATCFTDLRHNLKRLETYWEFAHDDPSRLVSSLRKHLQAFSRQSLRVRRYKRRNAEREEVDRNCLSIIVPLARGEDLAVYAKTNRRIRFEIRQDFTENFSALSNGHMASNIRGMEILLQEAREHCANRMNDLFAFIQLQCAHVADSVSVPVFLSHLASALQRSENFATVLSLLLTNGKLESVAGLETEIGMLKRKGIIAFNGTPRRGNYLVTPPYRNALAKLQSKALVSEFVARDR